MRLAQRRSSAGPGRWMTREVMCTHVKAGAEILRGSRAPVLRIAAELVAYHHERWDGTGYVAELRADAIPLSGRITALADTFDAMTHDRPHHQAATRKGTSQVPEALRSRRVWT
jgi:putative two-component system response regulator